jgi:hypothetical protein
MTRSKRYQFDVISESLKAELVGTGPYAPAGDVKDKERENGEMEEERKMDVLGWSTFTE